MPRTRVATVIGALALVACRGAQSSQTTQPLDRSCTADTDCTPAPSCCPQPCTEDVINVSSADRARSELKCASSEQCPQAGSCITHAYLCVDRQCKLVFAGDERYHPR